MLCADLQDVDQSSARVPPSAGVPRSSERIVASLRSKAGSETMSAGERHEESLDKQTDHAEDVKEHVSKE